MLDGRCLEIREVLARKRQNGGRLGRFKSDGISRRSLIAIRRTPESKVGNGSEMRVGLDRLMSGSAAYKSIDLFTTGI
jgi:hypothetical protein